MISDDMLVRAVFEADTAILNMLPDPSTCSHNFSLSFQRKMNRLIHKVKHLVVYQVLRRVACIFIAFLLAACMFLTFNSKVRATVIDWIEERFNEFYHYFFVGEDSITHPELNITHNVGDSSDMSGEKAYYLGWVPDGYVLMDSFETPGGETYIYVNSSTQILQFAYLYGDSTSSVFTGKGEYEQKYISDGSLQAEILLSVDKSDSNVISWKSADGNVLFNIIAFVEEQDLVKMARSLSVK